MLLKANLREAGRALSGSKQRSVLALLGIVIGIGSMIALVSMGTLPQRETLRQFMEMGTDVVAINIEMSPDDRRRGTAAGFALESVLLMPEKVASVRSVAPYASGFGEPPRKNAGNYSYVINHQPGWPGHVRPGFLCG